MSRELLTTARILIARPDLGPKGTWPRSAAILARQALEEALESLWVNSRYPAVKRTSFRFQLLCLWLVLDDTGLMRDVRAAWYFLSRACHHHQYELAPVAAELETWINQVERLTEALDKLREQT